MTASRRTKCDWCNAVVSVPRHSRSVSLEDVLTNHAVSCPGRLHKTKKENS